MDVPIKMDIYYLLPVTPSLELARIESERKFSHLSVGPPGVTHREVQTDALSVHVSRDLYTQEDIDVMYGGGDGDRRRFRERIHDYVIDAVTCNVEKGVALLRWMMSWAPIVYALRRYSLKRLIGT